RLAHQIWQEDVNARGGLLGREVVLICHDDQSVAANVPPIYESLLANRHIDVLLGGYGNNSISPAMPLVMKGGRFFVGLMGLGVNIEARYDRYFAMIPTGANPNAALTEGFFDAASRQSPKPQTVAILAADADFTKNPIVGARANAARFGFEVVSETKYSLATTDFVAVLKALNPRGADILFLCSYLNDSVGLVRAIPESGLAAKMIGGAMIGPQSTSVQELLGPLLNGLVNYEYWLPTAKMAFPGVERLISTYQQRAAGTTADALGYYVAPMAYAQLQVVEQAVRETGGLVDADLAEYAHAARFQTVVGDVRFSDSGEWAEPRVLTVQYQNIKSSDVSEFKNPDAQAVLYPTEYASGALTYPYVVPRAHP
ncbi:MAG TPA: amino acid ABC transporter substrate-binding protein, partial [Acidimicrobiales bacterium]|nr:amino acid ABC transporter substrate-binding protein [Acidimicrobiales bacterium]